MGLSVHAYAAPSPADIEKQIDAQWQLLEPIIEQYNGAVSDLKASQAKADALQQQLQPLQLQVDAAMLRIGGFAIKAYKGGRLASLNALLSTGSSDNMASNMAQLQVMARRQKADISDVASTRDQYAKDKRALDGLIAEQSAREAELAGKKKEIEGKIADLQKLRQQAYGTAGVPAIGNLKPTNCPADTGPAAGVKAATTACAQIGKPYVYATAGPNTFDCSGLTMYAWASAGKSLPHQSKQQYNMTADFTDPAQLQVGDLVYFYAGISHVGIYVGKGYMVHASRAGEPVAMVPVNHGTTPKAYGHVK